MENEQDQFEQVRRLLALKKHEQPPPRYFQEFSSKVIARLHALEIVRPATWRQRLGLDFDFRPAMMGAFGVVVCGLLLTGVLSSLGESHPSSIVPPAMAALSEPSNSLLAPPTAELMFAGALSPTPILSPEEIPASTEPLTDSPFSHLQPQAERAVYRP